MPDLKSELLKLSNLSFDDPGEPDMQPTVISAQPPRKVSLSERLWYVLRDNPSSSVRELSILSGVTNQEAANIANKFYVRQIATRVEHNGVYTYATSVDEYPRFDRLAAIRHATASRMQKLVAEKTKQKYTRKAKPEVQKLAEAVERMADTPHKEQTVDEMLNTMPIAKARALYDALKKIFGG